MTYETNEFLLITGFKFTFSRNTFENLIVQDVFRFKKKKKFITGKNFHSNHVKNYEELQSITVTLDFLPYDNCNFIILKQKFLMYCTLLENFLFYVLVGGKMVRGKNWWTPRYTYVILKKFYSYFPSDGVQNSKPPLKIVTDFSKSVYKL